MNRLDERVTAETAANRLGVSTALIRKWASRYKLVPDRERRYRFGDLVNVEYQTRTAKGRRRKLTTDA